VASVERMLFTDCGLPEDGVKTLKRWGQLGDVD
jgi:hypothetical protein